MVGYHKSSAAKASRCAGRVVGQPKPSDKSYWPETWGSSFYLCEFAFSTVRVPTARGVSGGGDPRFLVPQYEGVAPAACPAWRTNTLRTQAWPIKRRSTVKVRNKRYKQHQIAINLVPA